MTTKQWMALTVVAGGLLVALLAWNRGTDADGPAAAGLRAASEGQPGPIVQPRGGQAAVPGHQAPAPGQAPGDAPTASPLDTMTPPAFKARPDGRLVIDAQARADLERLTVLNTREAGLARLDDATGTLPEAARRDARDLYQQYQQYSQALSRALAPEQQEHATLDDARRQLQTVRELRAQYFGERAAALFGEEEAMQQQLLDDAAEAMKTRKLSQEEALGYAQEKLAREQAAAQAKTPAP